MNVDERNAALRILNRVRKGSDLRIVDGPNEEIGIFNGKVHIDISVSRDTGRADIYFFRGEPDMGIMIAILRKLMRETRP